MHTPAFHNHDHAHCTGDVMARAEEITRANGARLTPVRRRVLEIVAKTGRGRTTLIAGVNSMSPAEAISRIREAEELGYEALMLSPTPYSLPGQNEVVAYFKSTGEGWQSRMDGVLQQYVARHSRRA